jgi:hypothetical protein
VRTVFTSSGRAWGGGWQSAWRSSECSPTETCEGSQESLDGLVLAHLEPVSLPVHPLMHCRHNTEDRLQPVIIMEHPSTSSSIALLHRFSGSGDITTRVPYNYPIITTWTNLPTTAIKEVHNNRRFQRDNRWSHLLLLHCNPLHIYLDFHFLVRVQKDIKDTYSKVQ